MPIPAEPRELPDRLTPIPQKEFIRITAACWKRFYGGHPKPDQLACCLAQMVLETGRTRDRTKPGRVFFWGAHAHNFNWGNVKSKRFDENHWQHYPAGETINGVTQTFYPPHPQTKFRAYETAEDGMMDYIRFLVVERAARYGRAWKEGVLKGDVVTFSRLLGENGYYTAPVSRYTKTMASLFGEFLPLAAEALAGSADEEWEIEAEKLVRVSMAGVRQRLDEAFGRAEAKEISEDEARTSLTPNTPR